MQRRVNQPPKLFGPGVTCDARKLLSTVHDDEGRRVANTTDLRQFDGPLRMDVDAVKGKNLPLVGFGVRWRDVFIPLSAIRASRLLEHNEFVGDGGQRTTRSQNTCENESPEQCAQRERAQGLRWKCREPHDVVLLSRIVAKPVDAHRKLGRGPSRKPLSGARNVLEEARTIELHGGELAR